MLGSLMARALCSSSNYQEGEDEVGDGGGGKACPVPEQQTGGGCEGPRDSFGILPLLFGTPGTISGWVDHQSGTSTVGCWLGPVGRAGILDSDLGLDFFPHFTCHVMLPFTPSSRTCFLA